MLSGILNRSIALERLELLKAEAFAGEY